MNKFNQVHTPTPWDYEESDGGDSSVGMPAYPPTLVKYVKHGETEYRVQLAEFWSPDYRISFAEWDENDHRAEAEGFGEGGGYRNLEGNGDANALRAALCVNFCEGTSNDELRQLKSFTEIYNTMKSLWNRISEECSYDWQDIHKDLYDALEGHFK